jgi:hypothetical protein
MESFRNTCTVQGCGVPKTNRGTTSILLHLFLGYSLLSITLYNKWLCFLSIIQRRADFVEMQWVATENAEHVRSLSCFLGGGA